GVSGASAGSPTGVAAAARVRRRGAEVGSDAWAASSINVSAVGVVVAAARPRRRGGVGAAGGSAGASGGASATTLGAGRAGTGAASRCLWRLGIGGGRGPAQGRKRLGAVLMLRHAVSLPDEWGADVAAIRGSELRGRTYSPRLRRVRAARLLPGALSGALSRL